MTQHTAPVRGPSKHLCPSIAGRGRLASNFAMNRVLLLFSDIFRQRTAGAVAGRASVAKLVGFHSPARFENECRPER